ncbi:MAG: flagellar hook-associated protein FlgK [Acidobacteriaceae bacterium]|nr:flagellar hook-associated protein FlgK [Acidobacteriaceae bacterium]
MGSLFTALGTASNGLDVLEKAIGVTQNNVSNASTPGYVTQTLNLSASPFAPTENLWGGVEANGIQSSRDIYAEQAVWNANEQAGATTAESSSLSLLQNRFDVSGKTGIPGALSALYSAFSAWSSNPTGATSQQQVLTAAQNVAQSFNQAASSVAGIRTQTDQSIESTVSQVNQLAGQIAAINAQIRKGGPDDAGAAAQLYSSLEQLSNLVPIQVQNESDGTVTVLMDGQVPLVIGGTQQPIQVSFSNPPGAVNPNAAPDAQILSSSGQDVTGLVTQGQLGGLLQVRNTIIPSLIGDGQQQGSLNQLAQAVADRINGLLTSGQTPSGTAGVPLFSFGSGSPTTVASSLAATNIAASQLAAVDPGPPMLANGIASELAQLANPQNAADMINGQSYTDFYGSIATGVGNQASSASSAQQLQSQLLAQAQNMRAQISGVSLNEQAALLLQFQEAYQASAQVISVIKNTNQYFMQTMQQLQ